jgi:uncharacterized membrane protein YkoI
MTRRIAIAAAAVLIGFASAELVAAEEYSDVQEDFQEAVAQARAEVSLGEAIAIAAKAVPGGRLIESEADVEDGALSYLIEIEKDGVRTVVVDARTGRVRAIETE